MKYRLKYVKQDNLVFISHLDILKVIQRSFRRSGIHLEHSKGFNPHPKVHFAPPLPLFTSSEGEYVDVETKEDVDTNELVTRLNEVLPNNLHLINAIKLEENAKSLGKSLDYAIYKIFITLNKPSSNLDTKINDFINNSNELLIEKKNKKGRIVSKDIKPGIFEFNCILNDNILKINTNLSLRSNEILSPNNLITLIKNNFENIDDNCVIKLQKKDTILFSN